MTTLDPFSQWMVRSNLRHIAAGEDAAIVIATIRHNGYHAVADAVAQQIEASNDEEA